MQRVVFQGQNAISRRGLWVSDGTATGTSELPVAGASSNGLNPFGLTFYNGKVLFSGYNTSGHAGLWVSDGTTAGTSELPVAGTSNSYGLSPSDFAFFNGKVLFSGYDASDRPGLWVTDGTAAGTSELPAAGASSSDGLGPSNFTLYNGDVLFSGYNADSHLSLWVTDGTVTGTSELPVAGASSNGLSPSGLTFYNGKVLFSGYDASDRPGLWVTDGTAAGTSELEVAGSSRRGLSPNSLTLYGGKVLFSGQDARNHAGLWVSDGTAAGTSELSVAGVSSSDGLGPSNLTPYSGKVLFSGYDASNHTGLWLSDGTVAGTSELPVAGVSERYGLYPSGFTLYNGKVLFSGYDASDHNGLWVSDGTAAGTFELSVAGVSNNYGLHPSGFTFYNGKVLFSGYDASDHNGLWASDGTATGTFELSGASASGGDLSPNFLTVVGLAAPPTVAALQATSNVAGPLKIGRTVSFTLTSTAAVTVSTTLGSPTLSFSNASTAIFDATSSTTTSLVFNTTIQAGQDTSDLKVVALSLNGATIADAAGNLLDASALATLAGSDTGWVIDTTPPAITATLVGNPLDTNLGGIAYIQILTGRGDPDALVTLSEEGQVIGTAQADATGAWTYVSASLAPGVHELVASETDAAGNTGSVKVPPLTVLNTRFDVVNITTSTSGSLVGSDYTGPISYLRAQFIYGGLDDVLIGTKVASAFIKSGAGEDALAAKAGSNVLDGGTGSNWLVGATGADGGTDTFFVDSRGVQSTWDTLLNFHTGDMLTLWGFDSGVGSVTWSDDQGAAGYQGATLHADLGNGSDASVLITFAATSTVAAQFATSTGTSGGLAYLAVTRTA